MAADLGASSELAVSVVAAGLGGNRSWIVHLHCGALHALVFRDLANKMRPSNFLPVVSGVFVCAHRGVWSSDSVRATARRCTSAWFGE